jgi:hypothetical protein
MTQPFAKLGDIHHLDLASDRLEAPLPTLSVIIRVDQMRIISDQNSRRLPRLAAEFPSLSHGEHVREL